MGIFTALKAKKGFKRHSHISVSNDGVISTTSAHYLRSSEAKGKAVKAAKESRSEAQPA
jgi:hypothetical protein